MSNLSLATYDSAFHCHYYSSPCHHRSRHLTFDGRAIDLSLNLYQFLPRLHPHYFYRASIAVTQFHLEVLASEQFYHVVCNVFKELKIFNLFFDVLKLS